MGLFLFNWYWISLVYKTHLWYTVRGIFTKFWCVFLSYEINKVLESSTNRTNRLTRFRSRCFCKVNLSATLLRLERGQEIHFIHKRWRFARTIFLSGKITEMDINNKWKAVVRPMNAAMEISQSVSCVVESAFEKLPPLIKLFRALGSNKVFGVLFYFGF